MTTNVLGRLAAAGVLAFGMLSSRAGDASNAPSTASAMTMPEMVALAGGTNQADGLRLEFRNAALDLVLDYLSEAGGFVINKETEVKGTVDVVSKNPLTRDEAVSLLNSVLNKSGYAVVRESAHGRILTIISLDTAKTSDLEIIRGSDPNAVEKSAEVVTQIIPVRYANAAQLMNNLQALLPTTATLSVNESANTLILVATKTQIKRMLKIVSALDNSIANVSSIKVFPLRYADAKQLATVVQQLFTQTGSGSSAGGANGRAQLFNMPGGGAFGPFGPLDGSGGAGSATGSNGGGANSLRVSAVADEASNSLIVSASTGLLSTIATMVQQIDRPVNGITELRAFHLVNADPNELVDQLAQLFPDDSRSGSDQNQVAFRFGGGPPGPAGFGGGAAFGGFGGANNDPAAGSDRAQKKSRVLAVADARTSTLMVSAASTLMPEIAKMIAQLDTSRAKKEVVSVYELHDANPHDVNQILQELFNRNSTGRNYGNNGNSLLGNNDPLTARQTQQQNSTASGASRTGGAGGAGGGGSPGF